MNGSAAGMRIAGNGKTRIPLPIMMAQSRFVFLARKEDLSKLERLAARPQIELPELGPHEWLYVR